MKNEMKIMKVLKKTGAGRGKEGEVSRRWPGRAFRREFMLIYADLGSIWGAMWASVRYLFLYVFRHRFENAAGSYVGDFWSSFS